MTWLWPSCGFQVVRIDWIVDLGSEQQFCLWSSLSCKRPHHEDGMVIDVPAVGT